MNLKVLNFIKYHASVIQPLSYAIPKTINEITIDYQFKKRFKNTKSIMVFYFVSLASDIYV